MEPTETKETVEARVVDSADLGRRRLPGAGGRLDGRDPVRRHRRGLSRVRGPQLLRGVEQGPLRLQRLLGQLSVLPVGTGRY